MKNYFILFLLSIVFSCKQEQRGTIVVQTDFGEKDGAVSAMKGVAIGIDRQLAIYDLTHEIPAYNIWDAAYRLQQAIEYWPAGTVFVSVIDPGVGTARKSVVARTRSGKYIVTPDNGTLTLINDIEEIRVIDESLNRREGSQHSHTFHGRDVYMFTAAKLASGKISFEEVGQLLNASPVQIQFQQAIMQDNIIQGNIPALDVQFGNVWTNIPDTLITRFGIKSRDSVAVKIFLRDSVVLDEKIPFVNSFGDVAEGKSLSYINSLANFSLAINMGDFAKVYGIKSGADWKVEIRKK